MRKIYKIRDILKILKDDGWFLLRSKGSHRQYTHETKKGLVTVSFHSANDDLHPKTANSILKQAGLREVIE